MRNFSKLSKAELREVLSRPISRADTDQLLGAMREHMSIAAQALCNISPETLGLVDPEEPGEEAEELGE